MIKPRILNSGEIEDAKKLYDDTNNILIPALTSLDEMQRLGKTEDLKEEVYRDKSGNVESAYYTWKVDDNSYHLVVDPEHGDTVLTTEKGGETIRCHIYKDVIDSISISHDKDSFLAYYDRDNNPIGTDYAIYGRGLSHDQYHDIINNHPDISAKDFQTLTLKNNLKNLIEEYEAPTTTKEQKLKLAAKINTLRLTFDILENGELIADSRGINQSNLEKLSQEDQAFIKNENFREAFELKNHIGKLFLIKFNDAGCIRIIKGSSLSAHDLTDYHHEQEIFMSFESGGGDLREFHINTPRREREEKGMRICSSLYDTQIPEHPFLTYNSEKPVILNSEYKEVPVKEIVLNVNPEISEGEKIVALPTISGLISSITSHRPPREF